jgi:hypothetical protein
MVAMLCLARQERMVMALLPMTVPIVPTGWTPTPYWSRPPAPPEKTTTRWSALSSERSCR